MITRTVTYENYNGEEVTKTLHFHLKATTLAKVEAKAETDGYESFIDLIEQLVKTKDYETIYAIIEKMLIMSYGEKSEDGESFVQTDELQEKFRHTAALDAVVVDILTDDQDAMTFINGLVPKSLLEKAKKLAPTEKAGFSVVSD